MDILVDIEDTPGGDPLFPELVVENPPMNDPLFEELVELLEKGRNEDFIERADKVDKSHLKQILLAHDKRKKEKDKTGFKKEGVVPRYTFQYRLISREGRTILHYAMIFGNAATVKYLLKHGADPMATATEAKRKPEAAKIATKRQENYGSVSVVHCPCYLGKLETLKALFSHLEATDPEKVKILVSRPYQHTFVSGEKSGWLWTPLHYACGANDLDLVNLLMKYGADPIEDKGNVIQYASRVSCFKIVNSLIENYLKSDRLGWSQEEKKKYLEATINQSDLDDLTALHYATQKTCPKTVELLLKYGADPTKEDSKGDCPFHYAIQAGSEECAILLLESNCYCAEFIFQRFLTSKFFSMLIHQELAEVTIKLLDISNLAYRQIEKPRWLLHKAVLSDCYSSAQFIQIVKGLGKYCIEERNREGMTPMMLAASRNMHRKLNMMFHAYIELLERYNFNIEKKHYQYLYRNIIVNKDKKGQSMVHLAISCNGSESDFVKTIKVLNKIWKFFDSLFKEKGINVPDKEKDPFMVLSKCPTEYADLQGWKKRNEISGLELAFRSGKQERAIIIIEITKARTLTTVDTSIITSALLSGIQAVDFEQMIRLIKEFMQDDLEALKRIFNTPQEVTLFKIVEFVPYNMEDPRVQRIIPLKDNLWEEKTIRPLHLALKKKLFLQAKLMMDLELNENQSIVKLKAQREKESNLQGGEEEESTTRKREEESTLRRREEKSTLRRREKESTIGRKEEESTLHIALENGAPVDVLDTIVTRAGCDMTEDGTPQIKLPVGGGVKPLAIRMVVLKAVLKFKESHGDNWLEEDGILTEHLLNEAVDHNRLDIFEMLTVTYGSFFLSTLEKIFMSSQKEDFAKIMVRYGRFDHFDKLITIVPSGNNSKKHTTYFNELIKKMPDVALEAIDRSATEDDQKYKLLLDDSQHENLPSTTDSVGHLQTPEHKSTYKRLDDYTRIDDHTRHDDHTRKNDDHTRNDDYTRNDDHTKLCIENPLQLIVDLKRGNLLQHSLIRNYLQSQWRAAGFWVFFTHMLAYVMFLGVFSGLTQIVQHPIEEKFNYTAELSERRDIMIYCLSALTMYFWIVQAIVFCSILFIVIKKTKLKVFKVIQSYSVEVVVQLAQIVLVFTFCGVTIYNTITNNFYSKDSWRIGIFTVIFGWAYFIILGSKFPSFGEYVLIFTKVLKSFLKLSVFGLTLILASTIVLRMLFYSPVEKSSSYFTFDSSLVTLITMISGGVDFTGIFGFSFAVDDMNEHYLYDRHLSYLLWIVFLVVIPIVLSATLVGLAVGNASKIQSARVRKLELLVFWVTAFHFKGKPWRCFANLQKCLNYIADKFDIINLKQSDFKEDHHHISVYEEKRKADERELKLKYFGELSTGDTDTIQTIKEVTTDTRKILREVKESHDDALRRVQDNQARFMRLNMQGHC